METLAIYCPHCGVHGSVDVSMEGHRIRCSKCNTVFMLKRVDSPVTLAQAVPISPDVASPTDLLINHADGAQMVHIPAGIFTMGSTAADIAAIRAQHPGAKAALFEGEQPQHRVTLDDYFIYKYPVTVAQFRRFSEATGQDPPHVPSWPLEETQPVINVNWHEANAYAEWAGVRLPTEAQWEKAARGTNALTYPWGNSWDPTKCCHSVGSQRNYRTAPIGATPAGRSPYGVEEMAGNVWEWCADWYYVFYYQSTPSLNPRGPSHAAQHVIRGGSWHDLDAYAFRCAYRNMSDPLQKASYLGFRCVSS